MSIWMRTAPHLVARRARVEGAVDAYGDMIKRLNDSIREAEQKGNCHDNIAYVRMRSLVVKLNDEFVIHLMSDAGYGSVRSRNEGGTT